ncbi:MAG: hypothetical protein PVS3B3_13420 [Ktedonobacteraceae bacterium]
MAEQHEMQSLVQHAVNNLPTKFRVIVLLRYADQLSMEKAIGNLGRPMFFYLIFLFIIVWIVVSTTATNLHIPWNDPAPFF